MKKTRKILCLAMSVMMIFSIMTGCGTTTAGDASPSASSSASSSPSASSAPEDNTPVKLTFSFPKAPDVPVLQEYIKYAKEKLNYDLEFVDINANGQEYDKKLSISMIAGDTPADIFYYFGSMLDKYISADVLLPLNEYAQNEGTDLNAKFGNGMTVVDGNIYGLPQTKDIWCTIYNKKIFDDAGIPYPTADGWTWSKYVETAKKLTNEEKGIYGSFMCLEWDSYHYMTAHQKGIADYKADGTSNFDDPAFAEALEFVHGLGSVEKIQPDILTIKSKQLPWDLFAQGKVAMNVNGAWAVPCFMFDAKTYPRDWNFGVLPMPYPDGSKPASSFVVGGIAVGGGTENPEAAYKLAKLFAEDSYLFDAERMPTRMDMSSEEIDSYLNKTFITGNEADGVTLDDYKKCWFNPGIALTPEKVSGPAASLINAMFISEGELYGVGKKTAEDCMKTIKEKADEAIEELNEDN